MKARILMDLPVAALPHRNKVEGCRVPPCASCHARQRAQTAVEGKVYRLKGRDLLKSERSASPVTGMRQCITVGVPQVPFTCVS